MPGPGCMHAHYWVGLRTQHAGGGGGGCGTNQNHAWAMYTWYGSRVTTGCARRRGARAGRACVPTPLYGMRQRCGLSRTHTLLSPASPGVVKPTRAACRSPTQRRPKPTHTLWPAAPPLRNPPTGHGPRRQGPAHHNTGTTPADVTSCEGAFRYNALAGAPNTTAAPSSSPTSHPCCSATHKIAGRVSLAHPGVAAVALAL